MGLFRLSFFSVRSESSDDTEGTISGIHTLWTVSCGGAQVARVRSGRWGGYGAEVGVGHLPAGRGVALSDSATVNGVCVVSGFVLSCRCCTGALVGKCRNVPLFEKISHQFDEVGEGRAFTVIW